MSAAFGVLCNPTASTGDATVLAIVVRAPRRFVFFLHVMCKGLKAQQPAYSVPPATTACTYH